MIEILGIVKDTPVPSILVISGIVFLLLSFAHQIGSTIEIDAEKKGMVGFIGFIFLSAGIGLYLIPAMQTSPVSPVAGEPYIVVSPTPIAQQKTAIVAIPVSSSTPGSLPVIITETVSAASSSQTSQPKTATIVATHQATTPSASSRPLRPSPVSIPAGKTFSPSVEWSWICVGDFSVIRTDGSNLALYDNSATTGLILVVGQNSEVIINAPYGGSCEPFTQSQKDSIISAKVSELLSNGCVGGCMSVNIKEIDRHGKILSDYWN